MNSQISISRARLEHAEALLRELLSEDFEGEQKGEAGTLNRMLVHIVNMHQAVSTSAGNEANVAKRLGDFAKSMSRVTPPKPESAAKLERLADALYSAKAGLEPGDTTESTTERSTSSAEGGSRLDKTTST